MINAILLDDRTNRIEDAILSLNYLQDQDNRSSDPWFESVSVSYNTILGDQNEEGYPIKREQLRDILETIQTDKDTVVILDLHYPWGVLGSPLFDKQKAIHQIGQFPEFVHIPKSSSNEPIPLPKEAQGGIWLGLTIIRHWQETRKNYDQGRLLIAITSTAASRKGVKLYFEEKIESTTIGVLDTINTFSGRDDECQNLWKEIKKEWGEKFETDPYKRFINGLNDLNAEYQPMKAHDWMDADHYVLGKLLELTSTVLNLETFINKEFLSHELIKDACKSIYTAGRPKVSLLALWILAASAHTKERSQESTANIFKWPKDKSTLSDFNSRFIFKHPDKDEELDRKRGIEIFGAYWEMCKILFRKINTTKTESLEECSLTYENGIRFVFSWPGIELLSNIKALQDGEPLKDASKSGHAASRAIHNFLDLISPREEFLKDNNYWPIRIGTTGKCSKFYMEISNSNFTTES